MKEYKYEERSVGRVLEDKAKTIGEKVYLLHGDMKITYKEINAGANSIANSLLRLGIKKGDKVCVIMTNSVEYFHTWFAWPRSGRSWFRST
jgi:non-ribosomal peptide synthetase component E (peptide arylation enzyme)